MAIEHTFIGWCKEDNHDKVWGIIKLNGGAWDGNYVTYWGRRGKKLQTKLYKDVGYWEMEKLSDGKLNKGYSRIERTDLDTVYPEFQQDLEKTAFWAMFKV